LIALRDGFGLRWIVVELAVVVAGVHPGAAVEQVAAAVVVAVDRIAVE
jgi:hypothetical protein